MSAIGPTAFAVFAWGTIAAVLTVFCYEIYAVATEYGWLGGPAEESQ